MIPLRDSLLKPFVSSAPWLHYIPVKASYEDLYDIMAFFAGPIGPDGQVDETQGHDVSSRMIPPGTRTRQL
jgi:hypothetical protein